MEIAKYYAALYYQLKERGQESLEDAFWGVVASPHDGAKNEGVLDELTAIQNKSDEKWVEVLEKRRLLYLAQVQHAETLDGENT